MEQAFLEKQVAVGDSAFVACGASHYATCGALMVIKMAASDKVLELRVIRAKQVQDQSIPGVTPASI